MKSIYEELNLAVNRLDSTDQDIYEFLMGGADSVREGLTKLKAAASIRDLAEVKLKNTLRAFGTS